MVLYPPANVIWYDKNSNPINWSKSNGKRLVLGSVTNKADRATYTCKLMNHLIAGLDKVFFFLTAKSKNRYA